MAKSLAVLIVEDSESDAKLIVRLLEKAGYKVAYKQVETANQMRTELNKQAWDIVISDYSLPQFDGSAALDLLQKTGLDIPFIVVSGTMGEETAVSMMKAGAHDYLVKGKLARLVPAVERELAQAEERRKRKHAEEDLLRSRELFHQSFASLHDAIFIIEEGTHKILDCNPAACQMFGYDRAEILGQDTALLHVDKATLTNFRKRLRLEVQESGFFHQSDLQMRRKDGSLFFTDQTVSPLRDGDDHKITGWVSTIRDITERKQAEEALRKSEQVLREAESLGHTGSWEQDLVTGKIFNTGENLRLFFGDDPDKGEPFEDYAQAVHPDDREFVLQRRTQLLEGGPGDIEYRVVWPDGSVHVIFGRATVVRDELGQAIRVYGTNVDITERKQAEEALRESESILRGFLEQSTDAIMLADEQGTVIQWSKGAENLTGYSREESLELPLWDVQFRSAPNEFKSPEFYERMKAGMQAVLLEGQGTILNRFLEAAIQRPDGTRSITQTLAFSIQTHQGFQIGSILRDITESKTAEEKLRLSDQILQRVFALVIVCDSQANIIYVSPAAKTILGYEPDELLGDNWWKVSRSDPMEAQGEKEYVYRVARGEIPIATEAYERPIRDRWGNTHWISWVDAAGPSGLLIGVGHDITERKQAEEAVQESQATYRSLFEDSPISLWEEDFSAVKQRLENLQSEGITNFEEYFRSHPEVVTELAGLIQARDVNKATLSLFGADRKEDVLKNLTTIFEGEPVEVFRNELINIAAGKTRFEWEGINKTLDGRLINVDLSWSVAPDHVNSLSSVIVSVIDVTARKQAEFALRESEDRFRGLFEDSPISLWEEDFSAVKQRLNKLGEEGISNFQEYFTTHPEITAELAPLIKVVDVNKATMKLFGAHQKEALLTNLANLFNIKENLEFNNEFINVAKGLTRFSWEGRNRTLDGRLIDIALNWSAAPGYEMSLARVIVSMIDITARKQTETALLASEDRFRGLFEDSPISIWEEDFSAVQQRLDDLRKTGIKDLGEYFNSHPEVIIECAALVKIVDVNKATLKMFGADRKEDILKSLIEVFDDSTYQTFRNELIAIAAGMTSFRWEESNRTLDGRQVNIDLNWSAAPGYEKSLARVIVSKIDITERKQAEAALAKSEKEYRTLFENMPIGLYRTSADGRILDANHALVDMFGYKDRAALLKANIVDLYVDPASNEKFKIEIEKNDVVTNFEAEFKRADGTTFWTEDHNRLFRDQDGKTIYYEGSLIDITERKQAAAALHQSRDFAEKVIQTANVIFIQLDSAGNIQKFNTAAEEITGYSLSEVIGTNWGDKLVPRDQYSFVWDEFDRLQRKAETPVSFENSIFTKHGEERDILWKNNTLFEGDKPVGIISFGIDITERKRAEEALRTSETQLSNAMHIARLGYWEYDVAADLFTFNDHFYSIFHTTVEDEGGYKMTSAHYAERFVHPDDIPMVGAEIQKALETTDPHFSRQLEHRIIRADGEPGYIAASFFVVKDDQGRTVKTFGANQDVTERKEAEKRIQRQLEHLAALRSIDQVVISSFDLRISLTMILNQAARELGVDAADVLLLNSTNLYLEYTAGVGFRTKAVEKASVRLGQNFAGRVALERQLIQVADLKDEEKALFFRTQLAGEDFTYYCGVPLVAKGVVKGVLEVYHRALLEPDQEWLDFLNILADQAALAIDNANMFDNLQRSNIDLTLAYDATIEGWSRAMDLRDKETEGHTLRVTEMTMELAGLFGIKDEELVGIRRGALLHDIGKMGVPDSILLKPAMLTDEEWVSMRKHPTFAFEMLSPIHYLKSAIDIPYCHHEKWDGTGYPRGLKGEQIPLPARIFAIVDVWDAITSDRPYRQAWSKEKAIEHLRSQAGSQFDPKIVQVCLEAGVFDRKDWSHPTGHE